MRVLLHVALVHVQCLRYQGAMESESNYSTSPSSVAVRTIGGASIDAFKGLVALISIIVGILLTVLSSKQQWKSRLLGGTARRIYPLVNSSAAEYRQHAKGLLTKSLKVYGSRPFMVDTGLVHFIILDPKYAMEIRGNPNLDSTTLLQKVSPHTCYLKFNSPLEYS